jgi:glycosyltransferase involved in cell wall biosynthesis
MHDRIKIGFVLLSRLSNPMPSTRITVLNMLPFLRDAQFDPHVVFEPAHSSETPDMTGLAQRLKTEGFDIVFFQKVHGASVLAQVHELRAAGIKTVFSVCDVVEPSMAEATDATITVTDYLKSLYPESLQSKIFTVHDGVERPQLHKTDWGSHRGSRSRPLNAVLVTSLALTRLPVLVSPPDWLTVTIVGRYPASDRKLQRLRESRWEFSRKTGWQEKLRYLRFWSNPRIRRVAWDADGVYAAMLQADIGIIPIETDLAQGAVWRWQVKSENRLTLKMAAGLPVVATPIPAYEPVIQQGENGFMASSQTQWFEALTMLRDPAIRRRVGESARQTALTHYSMALQAERLLAVLRGLLGQAPDNSTAS